MDVADVFRRFLFVGVKVRVVFYIFGLRTEFVGKETGLFTDRVLLLLREFYVAVCAFSIVFAAVVFDIGRHVFV